MSFNAFVIALASKAEEKFDEITPNEQKKTSDPDPIKKNYDEIIKEWVDRARTLGEQL